MGEERREYEREKRGERERNVPCGTLWPGRRLKGRKVGTRLPAT